VLEVLCKHPPWEEKKSLKICLINFEWRKSFSSGLKANPVDSGEFKELLSLEKELRSPGWKRCQGAAKRIHSWSASWGFFLSQNPNFLRALLLLRRENPGSRS
jgi:hypothetical protein